MAYDLEDIGKRVAELEKRGDRYFELDARLTALESRAEAVEILLAEVFGLFSFSTEHSREDFMSGIHELCRRYRIDDEEANAGRRHAAVVLLRIIDAYKGKVCDWDRSTQLPRS